MRRSQFARKAALALLMTAVAAPVTLHAQLPSRTRRETSANRRARLAREIAETYSHRYEFSGGGGFLRFRSGEYLQKNSEITFYSSLNYLLNRKLGVLADVHGAFGSAKIGNNDFNLAQNPKISQYTFSAGPSYRFFADRRIAVSVFATGGLALGNFAGGTKGFFPDRLGIWSTTTTPVITGGVSFDYNFYPNLAARITPTYIGTFFDGTAPPDGVQTVHGSVQNNLGLNLGVVYRFGHRK